MINKKIKYNSNEIDDMHSVCFIMFGLLGDVLIRTVVLENFKKRYPKVKISVVVDPIGKEVFKNYKDIDNIIVLKRHRKDKLKNNLNKLKIIFKIRKCKFDMMINLYNGGFSPWITFFSGTKYKLGFCNQTKYSFVYNVKNDCVKDRLEQKQSLYNYMISIIEPFGIENIVLKPKFYITQEAMQNMKNYKNSLNYENIYLLNFGSGDLNKILDNEKYFELVKYIYQKYNYIPAIISNPSQEFLQENFIKEYLLDSGIPYVKLKQLSIDEIAVLIKLTDFIITPDTGLMHLAMAFNNYIYAIFTYTNPIFVDIELNNFIAVYENFDDGIYYQKQDISINKLHKFLDEMMCMVSNRKC